MGSGIHGCHLAHRLIGAGEDPAGIALLDPHPRALWAWEKRTDDVGMRYLRSPAVHHIGSAPYELGRLRRSKSDHLGVYQRPSLALFNRHARGVVETGGIEARRITGWARRIAPERGGWSVASSAGVLRTRRLVLATGPAAPSWPDWAQAARRSGAPIHHILEPRSEIETLGNAGKVVVVGAGMSAAQTAFSLAGRDQLDVVLLGPPLSQARFDSHPMWLGPTLVASLRRTPDLSERRRMIDAGRCPGTVTDEVARAVAGACAEGRLRHVHGRAVGAEPTPGGLSVEAETGESIDASALLLATGFARRPPGGGLLAQAVSDLGLPVSPCGRPVVSPALEWAPGLHVTGGLAELEIGAAAPNIAGAMRCAWAIVSGAGPDQAEELTPGRRTSPARPAPSPTAAGGR